MDYEPRTAVVDFGPIYRETDTARFPVEPWNTVSNLIFVAVIAYWFKRRRCRPIFFLLALPILTIGFIGGTLFHATRSSRIWLYLDFVPILLLAFVVLVTVRHDIFLHERSRFRIFASIFVVVVSVILWTLCQEPVGISGGYGIMAAIIAGSCGLHSLLINRAEIKTLAVALILFSGALACRVLDSATPDWLPMGSHFCWHLLGGSSVFFLFRYIAATPTSKSL